MLIGGWVYGVKVDNTQTSTESGELQDNAVRTRKPVK